MPESSLSSAHLQQANDLLLQASLAGIHICAASGDGGSKLNIPGTNLQVLFPASSPYVTAVGGTTLSKDVPTNGRREETVWNSGTINNVFYATGGGISRVFPKPDYQQQLPSLFRNVPDIALCANPGVVINYQTKNIAVGGTSLATPMYAGFLACLRNPIRIPSANLADTNYFNDITTGTNSSGNLEYYSAHKSGGYNNCTGSGSIKGTQLATLLSDNSSNARATYFTKIAQNYSDLVNSTKYDLFVMSVAGDVYGVGSNSIGELGIGTSGPNSYKSTLTQMVNSSGRTPKYISCGYLHTIILMTDGSIWGTGGNQYGQLGISPGNAQVISTLTQMVNATGKKAISIAAGGYHTIVLMEDGTMWGVGVNQNGQLGLGLGVGVGNTINQTSLTQMVNNTGKMPASISCGLNYTMVLMTDGSIWATGSNQYGQLGIGNTTDQSSLASVIYANGKTPKYISCGYFNAMVLMTDGSVWGTGFNQQGLAGTMSLKKLFVPDNQYVVYISCRGFRTAILTERNEIWSVYGSGTSNSFTRTVNNTGKTPNYISRSFVNTVALMTDGTVYVADDSGDLVLMSGQYNSRIVYIGGQSPDFSANITPEQTATAYIKFGMSIANDIMAYNNTVTARQLALSAVYSVWVPDPALATTIAEYTTLLATTVQNVSYDLSTFASLAKATQEAIGV